MTATRERDDLLQTLDKHRGFLRYTVRDLDDEQAARRTTVSALCLGGLIKHVAAVEYSWMRFAVGGAQGMNEAAAQSWEHQFELQPGETLASALEHYAEVAAETDRLVSAFPNLDTEHALPEAPWFEKGAKWSLRRVLLHVIAETAQHAGHADIIREALDGQKTMG
jgi:uncharacterized damage-inducible protein DinB